MNSKLSLVEAKNQARDEMEARARKRAKETCPDGVNLSRVRRSKKQKEKRIANHKALELAKGVTPLLKCVTPLPSAPYAPPFGHALLWWSSGGFLFFCTDDMVD